MFWIQRGQKTWFLTILLTLALLPTLAMAAPPLSPDNRWTRVQREQVNGSISLGSVLSGSTELAEVLSKGQASERRFLTAPGPTVRIDPAQAVVGAGQTFTVSVVIEEADDLGGFEFTLLFVTTTVTVDSVALGDFPGSTGRTVIPVGPTIDNQMGMASFAVATVGGAPGPSGSGVLATVTLTAQVSGESPLDLQDVVVLDTNAQGQTTTVEDGVVRVGFAVYLSLILKDWQK